MPFACCNCQRPVGFVQPGFVPGLARLHWMRPVCSPACLETLRTLKAHNMIDPSDYEKAAMQSAADKAGEFIDSIGQTDMGAWQPEQWQAFVETICTGYVDYLVEAQAAVTTAAGKVAS